MSPRSRSYHAISNWASLGQFNIPSIQDLKALDQQMTAIPTAIPPNMQPTAIPGQRQVQPGQQQPQVQLQPQVQPGQQPGPKLPTIPSGDIPKTGNATIDNLIAGPYGKAVLIGSLGAALAKTFPGKFFMPFIAGSVAALLLGIVKEPEGSKAV